MYIIIGGDGKEYGPISADDLRVWISEGRLNAQSLAKAESDAEFRTLATFPELAYLFAGKTAVLSSSPADGGRESALSAVKSPAIALIIVSSLDLLFAIYGLLQSRTTMQMYSKMPQFSDPQMQQILQIASGPAGIFTYILQFVATIVVLVSATRMLALKNYTFAFTGAIIALIPCVTPCCGLLTLPFGIWALVVLNKAAVKSHFN